MTKISNDNAYNIEAIVNDLDTFTASCGALNSGEKTKSIYLGQIKQYVIKGIEDSKINTGDTVIIYKTTAESIPSYTPVAVINNLAYKLDASNPLHQFAFVGFSTNGTLIGQVSKIKQVGELELAGWGLEPNKHYLAGANGTLILNNNSATNFTKIIGYATNANTLVIKDFLATLKTN